MNLEEALQEQEGSVDTLIKSATKYLSTLKAWKKACQSGHIGNLQKAAVQATEQVEALVAPTSETKSAWTFDVRDYLESEAWRKELQTVAGEKYSLRVPEEADTLISSPIVIRSRPGTNSLLLGKVNWPMLRPSVAAAELKRLRDRTGAANSQEFVDSLCAVFDREAVGGQTFVKFIDVYNIFSLTPGWKKENSPAAFGQAIYALHRSEVTGTRSGRQYEMIYPSADAKKAEIYTVIAEDGSPTRYYGIRFTRK